MTPAARACAERSRRATSRSALVCCSLALLAAPAALLLGAQAANAADEPRQQIEQRLDLVARMVADAETAKRIMASGNPRAISHLDEGRMHHALAKDALERGDLQAARSAIDQALQHVSQARRLAPDRPQHQQLTRQRYEQHLAGLERLLESWERHAAHADGGGAGTRGGNDSDSDRLAVLGLIGTARTHADAQRWDDALAAVKLAERHVMDGMNRLLHQRTIDYTARATTPQEQFRDELARHDALAELLPLALAELKPQGEKAAQIERWREAARTLRAQALRKHQDGQIEDALTSLRDAVLNVQRALGAAGVNTPAPSDPTS